MLLEARPREICGRAMKSMGASERGKKLTELGSLQAGSSANTVLVL